MALYTITKTGPAGTETITRKQKPSAFYAFQTAVYDAIRANAGLDTFWGRRAYAQSEGAAENTRFHEVTVRDYRVTFERHC